MDTRNKDSPLVYICSPYSGDIQRNTVLARRYSRLAVIRGCIPLAPHLLLPQFLSDAAERELAIRIGLQLLEKCQEVWICGNLISEGMHREIARAKEIGLAIRNIKEDEIECLQLPKA